MTPLLGGLLCGASVGAVVFVLLPLRRGPGQVPPGRHPQAAAVPMERSRRLTPRVAGILGGLTGVVLALAGLGVAGLLAGAALAVGLHRVVTRAEPAGHGRMRIAVRRDLPVLTDLLGACLAAGVPTREAVAVVAGAVGGPVGRRLAATARRAELGADARAAWAPALAGGGEALGPLAEAFAAAGTDGSALVPRLARLGEQSREVAAAAALAAAERAGVRAVAPLGLCFLPAFVAVGVVPVVAAALASVPR